MNFEYDDGGRWMAGYAGKAGDCVCRAIAIATQRPYNEIYRRLSEENSNQRVTKHNRAKTHNLKSASHGIFVQRKWFKDYMKELGFEWVPCMKPGTGCKVHLKEDELPKGRIVVRVSKHMCAVIDGVLRDTYDCSRDGTRCVYGYYILKNDVQAE